jgi:hypothetical protein
MIWPFKRRSPPSRTLLHYRGDDVFRTRPDYVAWASRTLASPEGVALQRHLFSEITRTVFYRGDQITLDQAALEYMRLTGYLECLSRLQEAAVPMPVAPPEVDADYDQTPPSTPASNE